MLPSTLSNDELVALACNVLRARSPETLYCRPSDTVKQQKSQLGFSLNKALASFTTLHNKGFCVRRYLFYFIVTTTAFYLPFEKGPKISFNP